MKIDNIIDDNVYEAFAFFKVSINCDFQVIQNVYSKLIKENHPDLNGFENDEEFKRKEEFTKEINKHHTCLRKYYAAYKKEILDYFKSFKKDENYLGILKLCDEYIEKVSKINDIKMFQKFKSEFDFKLEAVKANIKKRHESILEQRKKAAKNYFSYKYQQATVELLAEETIEALDVLKHILTIITTANSEELDNVIKVLDNIKFKDLDKDKEIVDSLMTNYNVFINIYTGDIVLVSEMTNEKVIFKLDNQKVRSMGRIYFDKEFVSLKDFIDNSFYVGDKSVCIIDYNDRVVRSEYPLTRFLYCHNKSDLMLVYEEGIASEEHFSFTSIKKEKSIDFSWRINPSTNQSEPKKGLFRDKRLLYESILKDINEKRQQTKFSNVHISEGIKR